MTLRIVMRTYSRQERQFEVEIVRLLMRSFPSRRVGEEGLVITETLVDGSEVTITLRAGYRDGELLYGADRNLLVWLLRRALQRREADVSWKTLLEFLGPAPTASRQKRLFLSAKRISSTLVTCSDQDSCWALPLVQSRSWSRERRHPTRPTEAFTGEICFVFASQFLELLTKAQRQSRSMMQWSTSLASLESPERLRPMEL
jgi:hypothetical protein